MYGCRAPRRTEVGVAVVIICCLLGMLSRINGRTKAADSLWVEENEECGCYLCLCAHVSCEMLGIKLRG